MHPCKKEFSRGGGYPCPLKMEDFLALSSYLDAHVLDFGTDVLDPDSAPSLPSGSCGQAPRHGARAGCKEPKPPEQDRDFTIAFHKAESNTNHERIGER
jgi:hypothetical protein